MSINPRYIFRLCERYAKIVPLLERVLVANTKRYADWRTYCPQNLTHRVNTIRIYAANSLQDVSVAAAEWNHDSGPLRSAFVTVCNTEIDSEGAWDILDAIQSTEVIKVVALVQDAARMRARADYLRSKLEPNRPQKQPFVATALQTAILDKLNGKAIRTRALASALHIDQPKLYRGKKGGGIEELKALGLVLLHDRVGYYRPDAPPPNIGRVSTEG